MGKIKKIKASSQKCVNCGDKAVAFFPVFNPNTINYPYCQPCLNEAKLKLMAKFIEK